MSMNWKKYRSVIDTKFVKKGRPLIVACNMRDICEYSFFLTPSKLRSYTNLV